MKHKGSLIINKPRAVVIEIFMNPNYNIEYQDGFVSKELIEGIATQDNAVSKMYYKHGKREMVLTETILKNDLPESIEAFYHHKHMDNTMKCSFEVVSPERTRYNYEYEYTRINWFMPKLMAILFPSVYRKQGDKWMHQFKQFVEKQ